MPVIKSAIKKALQSERKRLLNRGVRRTVKETIDDFKKKPTPAAWSKLSSVLDKAAKTNVLHKNKASRLKSRLSKLVSSKAPSAKPTKVAAKPAAKPKRPSKK